MVPSYDVAVFRLCLFITSTTGHESVVAPASLSFFTSHQDGERVKKLVKQVVKLLILQVNDDKKMDPFN